MSDAAFRQKLAFKDPLRLDPRRSALVLLDLVNDSISEGGFETNTGGPTHAKSQNLVANVKRLVDAARKLGAPVIHMHAKALPGVKKNAPVFADFANDELIKNYNESWGAQPVEGLEPLPGEHVMDRIRINAFYETRLDIVLRGYGAESIILTGSYTNYVVEDTARYGADAGYEVIVVSDGTSTVDDEWQRVALNYGLTGRARVATATEVIAGLQAGASTPSRR